MGADRDDAPFTADEIGRAAEILEALAERRGLLAGVEGELRRRLLVAAGRLSRPERVEQRELAKAFRRRDREERKAADGALLDATGIRTARRAPVFQTPPPELRPPSGVVRRSGAEPESVTAAEPESVTAAEP
ncbi:MAG: oxidoreductase, partial [Polyangiaceae bacterium]|nr:oxidoreductase [Polyangiaceae bacterium]